MTVREGYLRRYPLFESEVGRSELIHEIVPKTVTLRRDPPFRHVETPYGEDPPMHHETMFHEISMVPVRDTWSLAVRDLAANPPQRKQVDQGEFLDRVFGVFERVVEDAWDPDKFHVVHHTGGHDSRLIAWTLKRLYDRNGPEWLGDILFIELHVGQGQAIEALEAEGWGTSRFIKYMSREWGEAVYEPKDYYIRSCEFSNAWRRRNCGIMARGFNYFYEPIEWLQETGRIPPDDGQVQNWTGYLANELHHSLINGPGLDWALGVCPYHVTSFFVAKGESISPYSNLDLIRTVYEYGEGQHESQLRSWRWQIMDRFAPEVAAVPRPSEPRIRPYFSTSLRERTLQEYRESWYGQAVAPDVEPPPANRSGHRHWASWGLYPWWGHFGLASFCEELRRRGHEIRRE